MATRQRRAAAVLTPPSRGSPPITSARTSSFTLWVPGVLGSPDRRTAKLRGAGNPLPRWVLEGWERFDRIVASDVADTVHAIHARPERITHPLIRLDGTALLHGDFWLTNLAVTADHVVAIDWALATVGPPVLEFTSFLVGCGNQVDATHDEVLEDVRTIRGVRHDERALHLGLVFGLVELGWNLAWHVVEHPDEADQRELDWWVEAARRALATGLLE